MGSGKGGSFSTTPDWNQWAIISVFPIALPNGVAHPKLLRHAYGRLIPTWWRSFKCSVNSYVLAPIEGHGTWDGKDCFGALPRNTEYEGRLAVLTRATIRLSRLRQFWGMVGGASDAMHAAPGYEKSYGIGEVPWVKQATFSIWTSKAAMKEYAYRTMAHKEVISKTRTENWYSEEMFVRFRIIAEYNDAVLTD